jgi:hypothetical protein
MRAHLVRVLHIVRLIFICISAAIAQHEGQVDTCTNQQQCSSPNELNHNESVRKLSKYCPSIPTASVQPSKISLMKPFYDSGISAQAYKPNAPIKNDVCESERMNDRNRVARNLLWRSNRELIPISIRGNIYTCVDHAVIRNNVTMEVWQSRPDGSYSSLRYGVEDGDCRATVLVDADSSKESINFLGRVRFATLSPGSPGIFGGLAPSLSGELPPFGPGTMHFLIHADKHYPLLAQLSMKDVNKVLDGINFFGPDLRPHVAAVSEYSGFGGMEIQLATAIDSKLEVELNFFLAPIPDNEISIAAENMKNTFCSSDVSYLASVSDFFKEPISVCFPSLLDYLAL